MRELHLAKSAGFCYGVRRAVELAESAAASGTPCVLLGHIIHNQNVVDRLASLGLRTVESPSEVPEGCQVVIRSHGESRAVYEALQARGANILDARHLSQREAHPPDCLPGGGAWPAACDCGHAGPSGGGGHRRLVPPSGGTFWGGGSDKMALRGPKTTGAAPHICLPNHLHTKNLGRLREKSKKRVYKSGIF